MGKISGWKCITQFFSKYLVLDRKSSKTIITREQRCEGLNPFQIFHASSRTTCDHKMGSKTLEHLNTFPRESIYMHISESPDHFRFRLQIPRDPLVKDTSHNGSNQNTFYYLAICFLSFLGFEKVHNLYLAVKFVFWLNLTMFWLILDEETYTKTGR
jgi:hypothetical protein